MCYQISVFLHLSIIIILHLLILLLPPPPPPPFYLQQGPYSTHHIFMCISVSHVTWRILIWNDLIEWNLISFGWTHFGSIIPSFHPNHLYVPLIIVNIIILMLLIKWTYIGFYYYFLFPSYLVYSSFLLTLSLSFSLYYIYNTKVVAFSKKLSRLWVGVFVYTYNKSTNQSLVNSIFFAF